MEITCEHCEVTLNIPDEKIPEGQVVRISCPKCKSKISIDTGKRRVSPEQEKLALVLDPDPESSGKIRSEIEQLGYHCVSAPNTRDAVGKMRFHLFDLIIVSDGFDGQDLDNSPILNYLNHISIADRRKIFVALMGERFKSMDNLMAFAMSANAVINPKDTGKCSAMLKGAVSDHERFYKVFMETLVEVGRA